MQDFNVVVGENTNGKEVRRYGLSNQNEREAIETSSFYQEQSTIYHKCIV